MKAKIGKGTVTIEGRTLSFLNHPRLKRPAYRTRVLDQARALIANHDADFVSEASSFEGLHAAAFAASALLHRGRSSGDPEVLDLVGMYDTLCDLLYQGNLGLVYDTRRRTPTSDLDPADVLSDGCLALLRAVRSFNPWLGFRFSTYACRSIQRAFHLLTKRKQQDARLMRERMERIREAGDRELAWPVAASSEDGALESLKGILHENRADLTLTERLVITHRLLHGEGRRPATLGAVGKMLSLSKERVRQIQVAGLAKLREVLRCELSLARSMVLLNDSARPMANHVPPEPTPNLTLELQTNGRAA